MARVKFALGTIALLACGVLGLPTVHAQATVETGGLTGAASNVPPITPNFSGMAGTITGTDSPDAVPAQSATPAQVAAPEPPPALEAPVPDDIPDTAGDD